MIVKNKKERKERHRLPFLFILLFSFIVIYFIYDNNSIRIKTNISLGHSGFLYLFDIRLYFIIILIIFNYGNIYQSFILFYSLAIPKFILSLYYLILELENKTELNLFYNYFVLFFFFLVLCNIFFETNINDKNNNNYKGLFLFVFIFLLFLSGLTNTVGLLNSNIIFLDKIISGFLLSFSCYYFIFRVVNINLNDSLQLFQFFNSIDNNIINVPFFIMIIFSLYLKNDIGNNKYLSFILYIASMLAPLYGIIYEYKFWFNSNRKNWANFNFDNEKDKNSNNDNIQSLISEITITKSIKWNKTSFFFDILRLLVLIFIQTGFFYLSDNYNTYNIDFENKEKDSFLFFVFSIFLFIIGKIVLYWMRLINMTYFFLERNSINSR